MVVRPDNPIELSRRDALRFFGYSGLGALVLAACGGKVPGTLTSQTQGPASAPTLAPTRLKPPGQIPVTGGEDTSSRTNDNAPAIQPSPTADILTKTPNLLETAIANQTDFSIPESFQPAIPQLVTSFQGLNLNTTLQLKSIYETKNSPLIATTNEEVWNRLEIFANGSKPPYKVHIIGEATVVSRVDKDATEIFWNRGSWRPDMPMHADDPLVSVRISKDFESGWMSVDGKLFLFQVDTDIKRPVSVYNPLEDKWTDLPNIFKLDRNKNIMEWKDGQWIRIQFPDNLKKMFPDEITISLDENGIPVAEDFSLKITRRDGEWLVRFKYNSSFSPEFQKNIINGVEENTGKSFSQYTADFKLYIEGLVTKGKINKEYRDVTFTGLGKVSNNKGYENTRNSWNSVFPTELIATSWIGLEGVNNFGENDGALCLIFGSYHLGESVMAIPVLLMVDGVYKPVTSFNIEDSTNHSHTEINLRVPEDVFKHLDSMEREAIVFPFITLYYDKKSAVIIDDGFEVTDFFWRNGFNEILPLMDGTYVARYTANPDQLGSPGKLGGVNIFPDRLVKLMNPTSDKFVFAEIITALKTN